jgi:hypothetical protein
MQGRMFEFIKVAENCVQFQPCLMSAGEEREDSFAASIMCSTLIVAL